MKKHITFSSIRLENILFHSTHLLKRDLELKGIRVPHAWQGTREAFIPKAGTCGYTSSGIFVPSASSSFLLKTVEKPVDRYIREQLDQGHPLHAYHHAYRADLSTETAIHQAISAEPKQLNVKRYTMGIVIDIEGVFNHTSREVIVRTLNRPQTPPSITGWINDMLGNMGSLKPTRATPQSERQWTPEAHSPPLLWCLVINDLLVELTRRGYHVIGYAHEIVLSSSATRS